MKQEYRQVCTVMTNIYTEHSSYHLYKRSLQIQSSILSHRSTSQREAENNSDPFLWWLLPLQSVVAGLASSESEWPATGSGRPDGGQDLLQPQNVIKVRLDLIWFSASHQKSKKWGLGKLESIDIFCFSSLVGWERGWSCVQSFYV